MLSFIVLEHFYLKSVHSSRSIASLLLSYASYFFLSFTRQLEWWPMLPNCSLIEDANIFIAICNGGWSGRFFLLLTKHKFSGFVFGIDKYVVRTYK